MGVWAWRVRQVTGGAAGERFLVQFLEGKAHVAGTEQWTGDGVERSESEARVYAAQNGVTWGAFNEAVTRARAEFAERGT